MARPSLPLFPRARPSAARIGQLRKQIRTKRLAKKVAAATGSVMLDFIAGFLNIDIEKGKKDKLGLLGSALGAGIAKGGTDNLPLPTMEKPQRVSKDNNPSIATISSRLDNLVKTANKIGVYTKEQQEALIKQINQSRRSASEQQLEQKAPIIPELPAGGEASSLTPLDDSITGLIKKIDELSETVDGMNTSGGGAGPLDGLMGGRRGAAGGRAARAAAPAIVRSATSPTGFRYAAGAAGGLGGRFAAAPVSRAAAALAGTRRLAGAAFSGTAAFAASSKIANFMRGGIRPAAAAAGPAVSEAVRRAAGPIITRTLGRTALKSIPIIGAVAGVGFALSRLMKGDVIGAGIDLASGLGGPLTAIPAFAASVARDSYASVYGVQPEQDPNFNKNYPEIKKAVEALIKAQLGGAITPKSTPTDREIGDVETPTNTIKPAQAVTQPPAVPMATGPSMGGGGGATGGTTSSATGTAGTAPAATPEPSGQAGTTGAALNSPTMEPTGTATGDMLNAQQVPVNDMWQDYGFDQSMGAFTPQLGKTTRVGNYSGAGSIPSPVYEELGLEDFKKTLFFDY